MSKWLNKVRGHKKVVINALREKTKEKKKPSVEQEARNYLDNQLGENELSGWVTTVLTLSRGHKKVSCYGHWIDDGVLLDRLNLPIGHYCVSYPHWKRLTSWEKGFLAQLREFELGAEPWLWVALIGFEVNPLAGAVSFPRLPR